MIGLMAGAGLAAGWAVLRALRAPQSDDPEDARLRLEQRFAQAQRIGRIGVFELDLTTDRAWWSDEMFRILGIEPESFEPTFNRFMALVHPDDRARVHRLREEWLTHRAPFSVEYRIVRPDGNVRRILRSAAAVRDGEGRAVRLLGTMQDITERHLDQRRRRDSEERYRLLFEKNPLPLWLYDDETLQFLDVNDAAVHHYGFTRQEFLAMTIADIRPREDVARLIEQHAAAGKGYKMAGTWRHLRKDGSIIDVEIVRHQFEMDGRSVQLVMALDVTERLATERALQASREELANFTERLQLAIEEERTRISREIHDELGQALTGLRMHAAILESRLGERSQEVADETRAMTALIDDTVHTVRRIATELRPGVLDAFGLVAATEWAVQDFATRSGVRANFVNHLAVEPALGGERDTHVFRVVQEALTNVARHSGAAAVAVELTEVPGEIVITVQDNGRGFDPVPGWSKGSLGLHGMRERARLLGGTLVLDSAHGRGTRVALHVPREARAEAAQ
jgi:PAS domain S-box-containing protein